MNTGANSEGSDPSIATTHDLRGGTSDVPRQIREYQLLERLGQGGMGTVYKAQHTKLKRLVALKLLPTGRMADPRAIGRFEREMEAIGQLDHPSIVRATDAGQLDDIHYLVMEYVAGIDLSGLSKRRRLPVAEACELIRQAAIGLQCVHEHGLVHRDVKPSNIMVTYTGDVKILDLGLALLKKDEHRREMTASGQVLGTADYMAPEQATDSRHVDIRADIYSLGCTLYKLLVGRPPFAEPESGGAVGKMMAHVSKPIPHISTFRPEVPDALEKLVERMLAKAPKARFSTPADVAYALGPFAAGSDLVELLRQAVPHEEGEGRDSKLDVATQEFVSSASTGNQQSHTPLPAPGRKIARTRSKWLDRTVGFLVALLLAVIASQVIIKIRTERPVTVTNTPNGTTIKIEDPKNTQPQTENTDVKLDDDAATEPEERRTPETLSAVETTVESSEPFAKRETTRYFFQQQDADEMLPQQQITTERPEEPMPMSLPADRLPEVAHMRGHTGPVRCLTFSGNGKTLASGSDDQTVRLWDMYIWTLRSTFRGYSSAVHSVGLSADGMLLAWAGSGGFAQQAIVWNLHENGKYADLRWKEPTSPARVFSVVFSADAKLLATGGGGPVRVWDLARGTMLHEFRWQATFPSYVHSLAFTSDGRLLAAGCHGGSADAQIPDMVRTWNLATGKESDVLVGGTGRLSLSHDDVRGTVLYSPNDRLLIRVTSGDSGFGPMSQSGSVRIWPMDQGMKPNSYTIPGGNVYAAHVTPRGDILVAVAAGVSRFASAFGGRFKRDAFGGRPGFGGFERSPFSPNNGLSTESPVPSPPSGATAVALWDNTNNHCGSFETGHQDAVISLAFSPDGRLLGTGSQDNTIKVWAIDQIKLIAAE
jgi:serine/threonine protein kinase